MTGGFLGTGIRRATIAAARRRRRGGGRGDGFIEPILHGAVPPALPVRRVDEVVLHRTAGFRARMIRVQFALKRHVEPRQHPVPLPAGILGLVRVEERHVPHAAHPPRAQLLQLRIRAQRAPRQEVAVQSKTGHLLLAFILLQPRQVRPRAVVLRAVSIARVPVQREGHRPRQTRARRTGQHRPKPVLRQTHVRLVFSRTSHTILVVHRRQRRRLRRRQHRQQRIIIRTKSTQHAIRVANGCRIR